LANADVVLYDALSSDELLSHCKPNAELIFVGKRGGEKCVSQEYINNLLVEKAIEKGDALRLKGGDPFVFGRGQDEVLAAKQAGIEVTVIPGISSSMAGPTFANIPITARGVSDSFWVITGTKSDHSLSTDVRLAAQSKATVVLLMAMSKLPQIAEIYTELGRGACPVAIIQEATTPKQKQAIGQVKDIEILAKDHQLSNPAVIVIGEVVNFGNNDLPLEFLQGLMK
jgi:uroporphyrin-III C-methyltransferase